MARKNRRNFLPAFIINFLLWISLIVFLVQNPPSHSSLFIVHGSKIAIPTNIIIFFIWFTLSLTLTLALLLGNTRRGFLTTLWVNSILTLQLIKQANFINIILTGAILLVLELYFSSHKKGLEKKFDI